MTATFSCIMRSMAAIAYLRYSWRRRGTHTGWLGCGSAADRSFLRQTVGNQSKAEAGTGDGRTGGRARQRSLSPWKKRRGASLGLYSSPSETQNDIDYWPALRWLPSLATVLVAAAQTRAPDTQHEDCQERPRPNRIKW